MPVTYTSKHHSADDPGGLIREALDMGAEFPGPAQDLLLAWLLRLDDDKDPAQTARRLIETYGLDGPRPETGATAELVALLHQTATADPQRPTRRGRRSRNSCRPGSV